MHKNQIKSKFLSNRLRALNAFFIVFWCFIAVFPLLWVVIMSFKLPLDAFSSNPLQVIFGYETLAKKGGISFLEIIIFGIVLYYFITLTKRYSLKILAKLNQLLQIIPIGILGKLLALILFISTYLISLYLTFVIILPSLDNALSFVISSIPVINILDIPIIGITTEHYHAVWIENQFFKNFINSGIVTIGVVSISLTIGTLAGYGLARSNSKIAFSLLMIALVFRALPHSVLVSGYLPVFIGSKELFQPFWDAPVIGSLLHLFSDTPPSLYGQPIAIIVVLVAINQPFTIWMLRSFFANIPIDLDQAARVDGCSPIQAFYHVIMPIMWPGVITAGLFSFLLAYNDYLVASLLLDNQSQTMVPAISQYFNRETTTTDQVEAVAAATSIVIPLFFLVMYFQKQIVSGLTQGAVKG